MRQLMKFVCVCAILAGFSGTNAKAESLSFFDVPFKAVDYSLGNKISWLYFHDVIINGSVYGVTVPLDSVEILMEPADKPYTTLDIIDLSRVNSFTYLKPRMVRVTVRSENDLLMWQKFISQLKEKEEFERRRFLEPRRVLPPLLP